LACVDVVGVGADVGAGQEVFINLLMHTFEYLFDNIKVLLDFRNK